MSVYFFIMMTSYKLNIVVIIDELLSIFLSKCVDQGNAFGRRARLYGLLHFNRKIYPTTLQQLQRFCFFEYSVNMRSTGNL